MAQVYDHALWDLIGEGLITTHLESKGANLITEFAAQIKQTCMAEDDSLLKIGDTVATNNELML